MDTFFLVLSVVHAMINFLFMPHNSSLYRCTLYTVIIFLARNGRTRAVKFRPENFGRISFDLGEISPIQQILRLSNGRNSPKLGEIRPKFLRANLNCANSSKSNKFRPKKNYCVFVKIEFSDDQEF
jgi:hypothetical protein